MILNCRMCGSAVTFEMKVGFRDLCPNCSAYLHSCSHCRGRSPEERTGAGTRRRGAWERGSGGEQPQLNGAVTKRLSLRATERSAAIPGEAGREPGTWSMEPGTQHWR